MASLKELLDELADLTVRPSEINLPRKVFRSILAKAQELVEQYEETNEED